MKRKCAECGKSFTAARSSAKYCGSTCRSRARRSRERSHDAHKSSGEELGLVAQTRAELESAERIDSWAGQLALVLADALAGQGVSGLSSLSKEFRTVMSEATGKPMVDAGEPASPAEPEDPLDAAERRAAEKARAVAGT